MRRRFWICAVLTIPVFVIGMSDLDSRRAVATSGIAIRLDVDSVGPGDASRTLGRLAVFRARLAIARQSQSQHVHLDWIGCCHRLSL